MDERAIAGLVQTLEGKPTEELLDIWRKNDREQWRAEAFEAIARVLGARGVPLPEQEAKAAAGRTRVVRETDAPAGNRSRRVLKVVAVASVVLGVLLLIPLVATVILAFKENYWPPLIVIAVAVVVFLRGGLFLLRRARQPELDAARALSLAGRFVAGVFGCVFLPMAVGFGLWQLVTMGAGGAAGFTLSQEHLLAAGFLVATILYFVAMVLYVRRRILGASTCMIVGGVLSLPVGVLALAPGIAIRRAAQREIVTT